MGWARAPPGSSADFKKAVADRVEKLGVSSSREMISSEKRVEGAALTTHALIISKCEIFVYSMAGQPQQQNDKPIICMCDAALRRMPKSHSETGPR